VPNIQVSPGLRLLLTQPWLASAHDASGCDRRLGRKRSSGSSAKRREREGLKQPGL